jgi:2',3'-cyclic-nucleotide 2'-phosphodiesterase/3'-nucleotidase
MRKIIIRLRKKRYSSGAYLTFGISLLMIISLLWYGGNRIDKADAAVQKAETVNVRIIGTTDLHGQLNSKDYELGVDYNNGGLARVMDLITKTRNELPLENTVTLDAGDVLYDYTTEYIFSEDQMAIQPIYQAMAKIGYDAITLGNHDFDYGYEYILRQLDGSGLRDITVVSNVTDSKTGAYPFKETMLITRQMQTNSGKTVEVTIGIIGQTIPTLTAKTHSYAGILKTEDMVQNARTKAAYLKEMGADIIIALSHTGIGPENPELNFKNVAYALSKIPEIDVVVCGHEHNLFPTTDMSSPYFKLPNVDKKTYLMNGKNVIMAGDRGKAIGVVDLSLMVTEDEVEIIDRKSELRMVTAQNTKENKELAGLYGKWEPELLEYSTDIIGELEKDAVIQNWFGMLGDNAAIQLLNDSKIQYAINFTSNAGTEYKNYPIVAASTYASFGANSINDYINIRDQITESDLSAIQPYNNYLYIYTITGKQLKEWLEWSASAYETLSEGKTWKDPVMSSLMKSKKLKSLLKEEWLNDWSNFFIFDGIDYEIDPTQEARYDFSGNRISTNRRVKSVKVNGVDVTDDMVFLLATNKITIPVEANKGVEKQVVLNGFNRSQTILSKYLEQLSQSGSLMPQVDYNWRVSLPSDYKFIVKVPAYADELFQASPYYNSFLTEVNQYRYYTASYKQDKEDKIKPVIIAAPAVTSATASPFEVALQVTDASGIKAVRMLPGDIKVDDSSWAAGRVITNNRLTVYENGTYTIYAEDTKGNKTVKKLVINNFDENLLSRPTVESYTNRKTKISGKAEPNTTIVFETYTGVYEDKIRGDGKFSYALPAQPSGTILNVYIKDEAKGLVSEKVQVLVKRTGPNQPSVYPLSNNMNYIHGNINDDDAIVIAITDDTVYVPEQGGRELYKKASEIYDPGLKVVEVSETVYSSGYYAIMVPPQEAGKTVTIYNVDHLSRVSRVTTVKVNEAAPNAPLVYEVSNIEKQINGMVPGSTGTAYTITLQLGNKTYTTKTDKKGNFSFDLNREQLYAGQLLTVKASDVVDGVPRDSFATPVIVNDIEKYLKLSSTNLTINKVTSSATILSGYYYDGGTVYMAISEGEGESFKNTLYTLTTNEINRYKLELDQKLEPGTKIYVMTRFSEGKILLANMTVVQSTKPELPSLIKEIRNTDKVAQVAADKDCEVTLTIGKKTYKTKTYQKDKATGLYIYSFEIDRDASGTAVTVKASNAAGSSDVLTSKVLKAAPDAPVVKPVKAGDTIITGSIELLDYTAAAEEPVTADTPEAAAPTAPTITPTPAEVQTGTETSNDQGKTGKTVQSIQNKPETDQKEAEKTEGAGNGTDAQSNAQPNADGSTAASTPETIKSIPEKVAATQTQVFAQIGKKTYEGTIDNKGNFTITIPKQKAGTAIKLWGTNKAGRGPLVTIKVVE